jgi:hypothetical protein
LPAILLAVLVLMGLMQLVLTGTPDLPEAGVGRVQLASPMLALVRVPASPVILERPLFGAGRSAKGGANASPLGGATVAGSMAKGRQRQLFLREADGTIVTMAPGGTYHGWRLVAITEEGARFARGKEQLKINYGSQGPEKAEGDSSDESEEE